MWHSRASFAASTVAGVDSATLPKWKKANAKRIHPAKPLPPEGPPLDVTSVPQKQVHASAPAVPSSHICEPLLHTWYSIAATRNPDVTLTNWLRCPLNKACLAIVAEGRDQFPGAGHQHGPPSARHQRMALHAPPGGQRSARVPVLNDTVRADPEPASALAQRSLRTNPGFTLPSQCLYVTASS